MFSDKREKRSRKTHSSRFWRESHFYCSLINSHCVIKTKHNKLYFYLEKISPICHCRSSFGSIELKWCLYFLFTFILLRQTNLWNLSKFITFWESKKGIFVGNVIHIGYIISLFVRSKSGMKSNEQIQTLDSTSG